VRAVPDGGGQRLRPSRPGLEVAQHLDVRAYRYAFRRAQPLGFGAGRSFWRGGRDPAIRLRRSGLRHRCFGRGGGGSGFPDAARSHRSLGGTARPDPAPRLGADAHRLVEAVRRSLSEHGRGRAALAGTDGRGDPVPGRTTRHPGLWHRDGGHRCGAGRAPVATIPGALPVARGRALRAAMPCRSRPAAADRRDPAGGAVEDRGGTGSPLRVLALVERS
jgi:hypothetical protein